MAETAARILRDGALEGEFAPALMIQHSATSPSSSYAASSLLLHFLRTLCSHISAEKAQAKCLVFVVMDRSPEYYISLLQSLGQKQHSWLHFVDCYNDPLAWRKFSNYIQIQNICENGSPSQSYHSIDNLNDLLSVITGLATARSTTSSGFSVVIDSVSALFRHNSLSHVAQFLNKLRSCGGVSSIIWLLHSGLHNARVVSSLEYIATIIASIEQHGDSLSWNSPQSSGRLYTLRLRQKRRNGRIREQVEDFSVEKFKITTYSRKAESESVKSSLPLQVQFKLQLSDKERNDRARVILPFEHQGNGKESLIYNGRPDVKSENIGSSSTEKAEMGEINYLRDSDDERPDSDEDPDDDLDI